MLPCLQPWNQQQPYLRNGASPARGHQYEYPSGTRAGGRAPYSWLEIIENYCHICNVEQLEHFNRQSLAFISTQVCVRA